MSSVPKTSKTFKYDKFLNRPRVPGCIFRGPSAASIVGTVVPSKVLNLMQVKQSVQIGRLGSLNNQDDDHNDDNNDQNNSSARTSRFLVHFFDVHCIRLRRETF